MDGWKSVISNGYTRGGRERLFCVTWRVDMDVYVGIFIAEVWVGKVVGYYYRLPR